MVNLGLNINLTMSHFNGDVLSIFFQTKVWIQYDIIIKNKEL
jgi:hypothetical protein